MAMAVISRIIITTLINIINISIIIKVIPPSTAILVRHEMLVLYFRWLVPGHCIASQNLQPVSDYVLLG